MATKKTSKKPVIDWIVNIQFDAHQMLVSARTASEAKKKAAARLVRKGWGLVDKRNTYADKY